VTAELAPDELENRLFREMLNLGRQGGGPEFDLVAVSKWADMSPRPQQLIAFVKDNEGRFGSGNITMQAIRFTLNAEGRRHAIELEKAERVAAPVRWLTSDTAQKLMNVGNFAVAALALAVAIAAYFKASQ